MAIVGISSIFILSDIYICSPCDSKLKLAEGIREASVGCLIQYCSMLVEMESVAVSPVLVFSDSQVAITSVRNAAACGSARPADMRAVVDMVRE